MLIFSFIGYTSFEVTVGNQTVIDVVLQEDRTNLGKVVVNAGYWEVNERENTGNIANFTAEEIEINEVSKDADATAIYGSGGVNRVILITTKKGTSEKTRFDFNVLSKVGSANYEGIGIWHRILNMDWRAELMGGSNMVTSPWAPLSDRYANIAFLLSRTLREETIFRQTDETEFKFTYIQNMIKAPGTKKLVIKPKAVPPPVRVISSTISLIDGEPLAEDSVLFKYIINRAIEDI